MNMSDCDPNNTIIINAAIGKINAFVDRYSLNKTFKSCHMKINVPRGMNIKAYAKYMRRNCDHSTRITFFGETSKPSNFLSHLGCFSSLKTYLNIRYEEHNVHKSNLMLFLGETLNVNVTLFKHSSIMSSTPESFALFFEVFDVGQPLKVFDYLPKYIIFKWEVAAGRWFATIDADCAVAVWRAGSGTR